MRNSPRKGLIPFLDKLTFYESLGLPSATTWRPRSKKALDYQDFRAIARIKEKGLHHTDEGKALITKIHNQMNQSRLTTNNKSIVVDREGLLAEIDSLLGLSSTPSGFGMGVNLISLIKSLKTGVEEVHL